MILIRYSIRFYSFWFDLILIRRETRFTRESWLICESKIKSNQKSKVGKSWFTHSRIIGWFDFESKANQSESRIKLVRALVRGLNWTDFQNVVFLVPWLRVFTAASISCQYLIPLNNWWRRKSLLMSGDVLQIRLKRLFLLKTIFCGRERKQASRSGLFLGKNYDFV